MDLGTFYREFQNPPQLSSLSIDIGAQSMAEDLVSNTISVRDIYFYSSFHFQFGERISKLDK